MVRPGIVRSGIEQGVEFRHMAQEDILEPAATQETRTKRNVFHRVRVDVPRHGIDPLGQRSKIVRDPKAVGSAIGVRRQDNAIVPAPCHQEVGRAVHRGLAGTPSVCALRWQPILDDVKPVGHRCGVGPRRLGGLVAAIVGEDEDFECSGRNRLTGLIALHRKRRQAGTDPLRLVMGWDRHDRGGT